jgi:hypothetical protein
LLLPFDFLSLLLLLFFLFLCFLRRRPSLELDEVVDEDDDEDADEDTLLLRDRESCDDEALGERDLCRLLRRFDSFFSAGRRLLRCSAELEGGRCPPELPSLPSRPTWAGGCSVDTGAPRPSFSSVASSSPRGRAHLAALINAKKKDWQRLEYLRKRGI